jgi:MFS transporter, DHA2 family, multidrug resistance protein
MLAAIYYAIDSQPNLELLGQGDWFGIACMAIGLGSLIAFSEEGQNQDWFTSTFIQHRFELAVVFIPLFLIIELVGKHPVVNLRLLLERNLVLSCVINFVMGAGLYGAVFLLPQYLEQVQQYSARQTGEYMVLIGLPQLLIFPFVPRLMKTIDLRLMVFFGAAIFGGSCSLDTHMALFFGGPQFQLANVIRVRAAFYDCASYCDRDRGPRAGAQGDGSALFNIARNLGGSVGTALLSAMITQREQFHDFRIGERVTSCSLQVQSFLNTRAVRFGSVREARERSGSGDETSLQSPAKCCPTILFCYGLQRCFLAVGSILLVGSLVVWFCRKAKPAGDAPAGH